MKDENEVKISGQIASDLKITKYKDKENNKEILFVGFLLSSEKKRIMKREQPNNNLWINAYGEVAEFCNQYLSKGRYVLIKGTIETEGWRDKKGQMHFKCFIKAESITCLNTPEQVTQGELSEFNSNINVSGLETTEYVSENPNA